MHPPEADLVPAATPATLPADLPFNAAHARVLAAGSMTVGLMTPIARPRGAPADLAAEIALARQADALGFAALWTREVPLAIPQGSDGEAAVLDDPWLWLSALGAATGRIALGTAAVVLPLRHPLHVAKAALSLERLSALSGVGGRLILGLGSGDREAEFAAFGRDPATRGADFRARWALLRAALDPAPDAAARERLHAATGGHAVLAPPAARIPMLVVGSARQTLQWIAAQSDGWATYHREEARQQGRIGLWQTALGERAGGLAKPFVQSMQVELLDDPQAPASPLELGLRAGRHALTAELRRMASLGVAHVLLNLARGPRPPAEALDELGREVLQALRDPPADLASNVR